MQYTNLGQTGLIVSRLVLGGGHIGEMLDEEATRKVVHAAWDLGVNTFYTATGYNGGRGEELLGKVVKERRDDMVLTTKIGYRPGSPGGEWAARTAGRVDHARLWSKGVSPATHGLSRKHLLLAVEDSLRRFDTDYIDVLSIHFWDPSTPIDETLTTMDNLIRQGKVRYIGCSQTAAWQLYKALWTSDVKGLARFQCMQTRYNMLDRFPERDLLPACKDAGVSVMAFGSLAGGLLTGTMDQSAMPTDRGNRQRYVDMYWTDQNWERLARLKVLAHECGRQPGELAQGWVLAQDAVTAVLAGPDLPEELEPQARAVDNPLTADELRAVQEIAA